MMSSLYDNDLLLLLKQDKGREAFEVLYRRYADKLLHLAEKRTGNADDAMDLVQELFTSIWANRHTLQVNGSLEAYLVVSVKYLSIRNQQKQAKRPVSSEHIEESAAISSDTPFTRMLEHELQLIISREIEMMPEKMRAIYLYSRYDQLSGAEIAAKLSLSSQTVRNQISKAGQRLRKKMESFFI